MQPDPMGEEPSWGEDWGVGLRVWVERAGEAILGQGRLELLEEIDRQHSISAAARQLGLSYRHAWEMVQSGNQAAGQPLVVAVTGGPQGGGARLTPLGRWAITVFRRLQDQLQQLAGGLFPRLLHQTRPSGLHVAAAVSLEEPFDRLLNDFAVLEPAVRVRAVYGASDELADQLLAGAPADLFLTADPAQLDRLRAAGLLGPDQRVPLAENGLAAVALAERDLPIRRPADLAGRGVARIAVAGLDSPLGRYTRAYLNGLNLAETVGARAVQVENSRAVVSTVRAGQADVGLVYSSDAVRAEHCRILFRARQMPLAIRYVGAVVCRNTDPESARRLLAFLQSPAARRCFRRCGFLPSRPVNPAAE